MPDAPSTSAPAAAAPTILRNRTRPLQFRQLKNTPHPATAAGDGSSRASEGAPGCTWSLEPAGCSGSFPGAWGQACAPPGSDGPGTPSTNGKLPGSAGQAPTCVWPGQGHGSTGQRPLKTSLKHKSSGKRRRGLSGAATRLREDVLPDILGKKPGLSGVLEKSAHPPQAGKGSGTIRPSCPPPHAQHRGPERAHQASRALTKARGPQTNPHPQVRGLGDHKHLSHCLGELPGSGSPLEDPHCPRLGSAPRPGEGRRSHLCLLGRS